MKKIIIIVFVIVILVALGIGGWFLFKKSTENKITQGNLKITQGNLQGFGEQIFDKIEQNPTEKIPDINPFQQIKNPYEEAYSNPFK